MRPAPTLLAALAAAVLLITVIDHVVAASRASGLCEAFRPGLKGDEVHTLISGLADTSGFVRLRGDPDRMLTAPPAPAGREEFVQFAIVFKGLLFRTRQCVVSVKAGRVENSQVTNTDAYVILNPVQTVRSR